MEIIETFKNIELIRVSEDRYCVRKKSKFLFFKSTRFANLDLRGTGLFISNTIIEGITISNYQRAKYIFDCNCLTMGSI